jgi:hypothetical protein
MATQVDDEEDLRKLQDSLKTAQAKADEAERAAYAALRARETERGPLGAVRDYAKRQFRSLRDTGAPDILHFNNPTDEEAQAAGRASLARAEVKRIQDEVEFRARFSPKEQERRRANQPAGPKQGPEPPPTQNVDETDPQPRGLWKQLSDSQAVSSSDEEKDMGKRASLFPDLEPMMRAAAAQGHRGGDLVDQPQPLEAVKGKWEGDSVDSYAQRLIDEAGGSRVGTTSYAEAFQDNEPKSSETLRQLREAQFRIDFTRRYGQEPDSVRWTTEGEPVPVLGRRSMDSVMNRLQMEHIAAQNESMRAQVEGTDSASVARRQAASARTEELAIQERKARLAEEKQARADEDKQRKEQEAYATDTADIIPFARGAEGDASTRAFAQYVDLAAENQTTGLPLEALQAAEQGANRLLGIVSGVGRERMMMSTGESSVTERRNRKAYIEQLLPRIQKDIASAKNRTTTVGVNQTPGNIPSGMPEMPGGADPSLVGNVLNHLGPASVNPVGPGMFDRALSAIGNAVVPGARFGGSELSTQQLGVMPTTEQARRSIQSIAARSDAVGRATNALLMGMGSEAQRDAMMKWLATNYGVDVNQYMVRKSVYTDPVWMEQVKNAISSIQKTTPEVQK